MFYLGSKKRKREKNKGRTHRSFLGKMDRKSTKLQLHNFVCLPQPPLVDLTQKGSKAVVFIDTTQHKFATDAKASGTDPTKVPIFGSRAEVDGKLISTRSFGLPFFRKKRGQSCEIQWINKTGYTTNLHEHGGNHPPPLDGGSTYVVFGEGTQLGTTLKEDFPPVTNNSALLWVHAHPMFLTLEFVYLGLAGLVDVIDDLTWFMNETFEYGNNRLLLTYQDVDLNADGTITIDNLIVDGNRSAFGAINGLSCINWYSSSKNVPFVDKLFYPVGSNLVKIDILNAGSSFRTL